MFVTAIDPMFITLRGVINNTRNMPTCHGSRSGSVRSTHWVRSYCKRSSASCGEKAVNPNQSAVYRHGG